MHINWGMIIVLNWLKNVYIILLAEIAIGFIDLKPDQLTAFELATVEFEVIAINCSISMKIRVESDFN